MNFRQGALALIILILFSLATKIEAEENPLLIVQSSTTKMIEQLQHRKTEIVDNPTIVMSIVEDLLLPYFATNTISRKVLGRAHYKKASEDQKKKFAAAFRFYMIRFYAKAFATYSNQTIEYLRAPAYVDKKKVTVKTKLVQAGGKPIPIDYIMQRSGDSWKIIDLKIEGISLVISNRKQFGTQISRDGIDTVIAKLEYKNKKAQRNE